jgi:invasion protein IalB
MRAETRERWQQLCEQAANEQDPRCLTELVCEIDQILAEKQKRLRAAKEVPELVGQ